MAQIHKEISKTPFILYQTRIDEIIGIGGSGILSGHRISKQPIKYAFYLKKPFLPIGLPFQYKTALIATFESQSDETIITTTIQTPPFVPIAFALAIFWFVFDFFILKSSASIEVKVFFTVIALATAVYHSMTKNKVQEAFRNEIMLFL